MIASISVRMVFYSSMESLELPTIFRRQRLVDRTRRSNTPPHQGARSTLNFQSTPRPDKDLAQLSP